MQAEKLGKYKFILQTFALSSLPASLQLLGPRFLRGRYVLSLLYLQSLPAGRVSIITCGFFACISRARIRVDENSSQISDRALYLIDKEISFMYPV